MKDWLKQARPPCNKYSGVGGEGLLDRPPRIDEQDTAPKKAKKKKSKKSKKD